MAATTVTLGTTVVTVTDVEQREADGGDGDDTLLITEAAGAVDLFGGDGFDTFQFADGASITGTVDGGLDRDELDLSAYTTAVAVDLSSGTATGTGGIVGVNRVRGGSAADTLVGDANENALFGNGGNDTLTGGASYDYLDGGSEIDTVSESTDATFTLSDSGLSDGFQTDGLTAIEDAVLTLTDPNAVFTVSGCSLLRFCLAHGTPPCLEFMVTRNTMSARFGLCPSQARH